LFNLVVLPALALEGGRAILEELFLPAVEPNLCTESALSEAAC
jgi:hypothetical protein